MDEVTWTVSSGAASSNKKLDYVSPWKTFSKLTEEEKEKKFNEMRAELIMLGRMENR